MTATRTAKILAGLALGAAATGCVVVPTGATVTRTYNVGSVSRAPYGAPYGNPAYLPPPAYEATPGYVPPGAYYPAAPVYYVEESTDVFVVESYQPMYSPGVDLFIVTTPSGRHCEHRVPHSGVEGQHARGGHVRFEARGHEMVRAHRVQ